MAEKIIIAELEINTKALLKENTELVKSLAQLRAEQKQLRAETNNLVDATEEQARQYVETEAQIKSLNAQYNANGKVLAENVSGVERLSDALDKEAKSVGEARAQNKTLISVRNQIDETTTEGAAAIEQLNNKIDENNAIIEANVSQFEQQKIGIGRYEESVVNALNQVNLFGVGLGDVYKKGVEMKNGLIAQKDSLIQHAAANTGAAAATEKMTLAQKAQTVVTYASNNALKLFKIALASTGIGLLVVALGALTTYLNTTQAGINKVNSVLIPLKTIFQSLIGIVQQVGERIFNAFANPKQAVIALWEAIKTNIVNRVVAMGELFSSVGKIITSGFIDGYEDLANASIKATTGINNAMGKTREAAAATKSFFNAAIERGSRVAEIQQKLSASEADYIETLAKNKELFKEQNKLAEDVTKTFAEREAAARKSVEILNKSNQLTRERNALELEYLDLNTQNNDTSDADRAEIARKKAELFAANTELLEAETTQQNKINTIRQGAANQAKAILDQQVKDKQEAEAEKLRIAQEAQQKEVEGLNEQLALYVAKGKLRQMSSSEAIKYEQEVADQQNAIIDKQLQYGLVSKAKAETDKLAIEAETRQKQAQIAADGLAQELRLYELTNKSKLETGKRLNDDLIQLEKTRLQEIQTQEEELLRIKQQNGLISQADYNEQLLSLQQDYNEQRAQIDRDFLEQQKVDAATSAALEFEEKMLLLQQRGAAEAEIRLAQTKEQYRLEKQALDDKLAAQTISYENYNNALNNLEIKKAQAEIAINTLAANAKLSAYAQVAGAIANIAGRESNIGKAAAAAQASINSYIAFTKVLSELGIAGPVVAPGILAAGLTFVSKIKGTKTDYGAELGSIVSALGTISANSIPKAAKGGLFKIGGKRHSAGGTKFVGEDNTVFEAEKDEIIGVMNRRAASLFMDFNNTFGSGGVVTPNYFAAGGVVNRSASLDYELLASYIAQANKSIVNQVSVVEVIDKSASHIEVADGANLF